MIEVTELRKRYGPALSPDSMTFSVRPGQVTGFVGPNGAGNQPRCGSSSAWTRPTGAPR